MHGARDQRHDAHPFVQAVHLVQPAEQPLQHARARGKHHARRHGGYGEDARQLHRAATEAKVGEGLRKQPLRVSQQPERNERKRYAPEGDAYVSHDVRGKKALARQPRLLYSLFIHHTAGNMCRRHIYTV